MINYSDWILADFLKSGVELKGCDLPLIEEKDSYKIQYPDPSSGKVMLDLKDRPYCRKRMSESAIRNGAPKYLTEAGAGIRIYIPMKAHKYFIDNPNAPVLLTEGEKKSMASTVKGVPCLGLAGIWGWMRTKSERTETDEINPDLMPYIKRVRKIILLYDSDATDKNKALDFDDCAYRFAKQLAKHGCSLFRVNLPSDGESKVGLDDYLLKHSIGELQLYIEKNKVFVNHKRDTSPRLKVKLEAVINEIQTIPEDTDHLQIPTQLEPILKKIAELDEIYAEPFLTELEKRFRLKKSISTYRQKLKKLRKQDRSDRRSATSIENGQQGGRPFISVQNFADEFISINYTDKSGNITLAYYKGRYYYFNGRYYLEISNSEIQSELTGFLRKNYSEDYRIGSTLIKDVLSNLNATNLTGITRVTTLPFWRDTKEAAKNLIICNNGILDIDNAVNHLKEGKALELSLLRPLTPNLFSTYGIDYKFNPIATCPKWLKYLEEVQPELEVRTQIQMLFGLALIPETKYNKAFIFLGEGGTGKSVCLYILEHLVGVHNCCCVPLGSLADKFSLHPLTVKLLNIVSELPAQSDKTSLSAIEGTFKNITDGEPLHAEKKFHDGEKARATARWIQAGNELPYFADKTHALWDRLVIIMFNQRFRHTDKENVNLRYEIASEELSGIFNWAILGLANLLINHKTFPETKEGRKVKEMHRDDCDHERCFLISHYAEKIDSYVEGKLVYSHYKEWMNDNGFRPIGNQRFIRAVERVFKKVFYEQKRISGERPFIYSNLQKTTYL